MSTGRHCGLLSHIESTFGVIIPYENIIGKLQLCHQPTPCSMPGKELGEGSNTWASAIHVGEHAWVHWFAPGRVLAESAPCSMIQQMEDIFLSVTPSFCQASFQYKFWKHSIICSIFESSKLFLCCYHVYLYANFKLCHLYDFTGSLMAWRNVRWTMIHS